MQIKTDSNRPVYNEEIWDIEYSPDTGSRHDSLVKCINKNTGEVYYFELQEIVGF